MHASVRDLGYRLFDCDNHLYEPRDSFARYIEPAFRDRVVRPVVEDGREVVMVGDRRLTFTEGYEMFDRVARPGTLRQMLRQMKSGIVDEAGYAWEAPRPEYGDRDARLALMDEQGVEAALMFPSVALVVEHFFADADQLYANFHAFNRWLDEEWGFAHLDRIFCPPALSLCDLERAVAELDWVLERGARVVMLRPGPAYGRSPGDPYFDPFWARLNEARGSVAFHQTESGYNQAIGPLWGEPPNPTNFGMSAWQWTNCYGDRPIMDTLSALVFDGLFDAFPNLTAISVENGCEWMPYLVRHMDKMKGMGRSGPWRRGRIRERPSEVWKRHVRATPYAEDDIARVAESVGAECLAMGSDFPHAEGLESPAEFVELLDGLPDPERRLVLRDNGRALVAS